MVFLTLLPGDSYAWNLGLPPHPCPCQAVLEGDRGGGGEGRTQELPGIVQVDEVERRLEVSSVKWETADWSRHSCRAAHLGHWGLTHLGADTPAFGRIAFGLDISLVETVLRREDHLLHVDVGHGLISTMKKPAVSGGPAGQGSTQWTKPQLVTEPPEEACKDWNYTRPGEVTTDGFADPSITCLCSS